MLSKFVGINKNLMYGLIILEIADIVQLNILYSSIQKALWLRICLYLYGLDVLQRQRCSLTMNHVDIWYEIAKQKLQLALILEDDAIFVPFFKEKLTRLIYAANRTGALRLNGQCAMPKEKPILDDEWINHNPMIVVGMGGSKYRTRDPFISRPKLIPHKLKASRCSHGYLLTSCSAQALIDQIHAQKNIFLPADIWLDYLFRLSPILQAFWLYPPLIYQGNKVIDLDNLETFKGTSYIMRYKTAN